MTPVRIQRKRTKGFDLQSLSISVNGLPAACVDRSSRYGNPYVVKRNGKGWSVENSSGIWLFETKEKAHLAASKLFRAWIDAPQNSSLKRRGVLALRDRNLACFCSLTEACHADVWLEMLKNEGISS